LPKYQQISDGFAFPYDLPLIERFYYLRFLFRFCFPRRCALDLLGVP
jgi:hypothetical protein